METLKRFFRDERGIESVEWALILGIIVLAAVMAAGAAKTYMTDIFSSMESSLSDAAADLPSGST